MTALSENQKERQRAARARAGQIRFGMQNYIETLGVIAQARANNDHETLGYDSWAEYVDNEFGDGRLKLPSDMRQKAITELRLAGASQREIAHTVGVNQSTVSRALGSGDAYASPSGFEGAGQPVVAVVEDVPAATPGAAPAEPPVDRESRPDQPVVTDPGTVTDAAAGQDPRPATPLVDTPIGPITQKVADALDKHVPNPDPHAEWRLGYLKRIHSVHAVMRSKPEDVAAMADETCLDELARCIEALVEYRRAVVRAVMANTPDNVTPIRRPS